MLVKDVKTYIEATRTMLPTPRRSARRFGARRCIVRIKSAEQQGQLMQHRTRDLVTRRRTQLMNALRAHLAEVGIVAARLTKGVKELLAIVADDGDERSPIDTRLPQG
jgi:transposase